MATQAELKAALDTLEANVTADGDVVTSTITLLTQLSTMLKDAQHASTPQEALDQVAAIAALVDSQKAALAEAVAANTPGAP